MVDASEERYHCRQVLYTFQIIIIIHEKMNTIRILKPLVLVIILLAAFWGCGTMPSHWQKLLAITLDGKDDEWRDVPNTADSTVGAVSSIAGFYDSTYLYLLARGSGLDKSTDWFLDTDDNYFSGYITGGGADVLLENGRAFIYSGSGTDWVWTKIDDAHVFEGTGSTVVETAVAYADLGFNPSEILPNIAFGSGFTHYLPGPASPVKLVSPLSGGASEYPDFSIIPNALGMAIDDVGWLDWEGGNSRDALPSDYKTIIDVGKNLGIRIMTAFIMLDFDKTNLSAGPAYNSPEAPSNMSKFGTRFDNPHKNNAQLDEIMGMYREAAAYIELGVHGVGHEHWGGSKTNYDSGTPDDPTDDYSRAEFAHIQPFPDIYHSEPWGTEDNRLKLSCWEDILRLYFTEEECSFPKSMVPPGHAWYYGSDGKGSDESTGSVAGSFGIKYLNCDMDVSFAIMGGVEPTGLVDNGVLVMHRASGADYYAEGETAGTGTNNQFEYPAYPGSSYSWIEAHFPNYWNSEGIWTEYLTEVNNAHDRMLAKNTAQVASQWLYRHDAQISGSGGTFTIDTRAMRNEAYHYGLLSVLVLKTPLFGKHIRRASIDGGAQITAYWEDNYDYGYLMIGHEKAPMGRLPKGVYTLRAEYGEETMESFINLTESTFNVYSYSYTADSASLALELYGTQDISIKLPFFPGHVESQSPGISVNNWAYDDGFLSINATGLDIQGETGKITIAK